LPLNGLKIKMFFKISFASHCSR